MAHPSQKTPVGNARVVTLCLFMTFGMLGMAYAAVPLYQWFCQVTGYAGTTQRADDTTGTVLDRKITVRFDANISNDLDWEFAPQSRSITLKIGDKSQAIYTAKNIGDDTSHGTATFNVSPGLAGAYFNKIECFCFTSQPLQPGEEIEMPVQFFVDPAIDEDHDLDAVRTITLSYPFFPVAEAGQPVAHSARD